MSLKKYAEDERRWCELMTRAQQGDRRVYESLLTELADVIEAYLRLRFGAIDMLEDCVQECLITIHKARDTYDPRREFRPWMFTLVRHRMIDLLRERSCRIQATEVLNEEELDLTDPEHIHRLIDGVRVLESLKPDYREAVALTKYAGMTTLEAASWLGVSESAIKARLRRGLVAIHRQLELEESMT
jgi:RNA polymerase sigma-70 factor (ECF subfamily)